MKFPTYLDFILFNSIQYINQGADGHKKVETVKTLGTIQNNYNLIPCSYYKQNPKLDRQSFS